MAFPKKVDKNQKEIVSALRDYGASVQSLSSIGHGCPDILVGYMGQNYLMEIKSQKGSLTDDQVVWIKDWQAEVHIVRSADDAVAVLRDNWSFLE